MQVQSDDGESRGAARAGTRQAGVGCRPEQDRTGAPETGCALRGDALGGQCGSRSALGPGTLAEMKP